jgi:hypothetical protein
MVSSLMFIHRFGCYPTCLDPSLHVSDHIWQHSILNVAVWGTTGSVRNISQ